MNTIGSTAGLGQHWTVVLLFEPLEDSLFSYQFDESVHMAMIGTNFEALDDLV